MKEPGNIARLTKIVSNKSEAELDSSGRRWNLTNNQMTIIDFLAHHNHEIINQKDIETEFSIKKSTAPVIIQRMEKKQLLQETVTQVMDRKNYFTNL